MDKVSVFQAILGLTKTVGPIIAVEKIYKGMFDHRFSSPKYFSFTMEDFPTMEREKHTFKSYNKNKLISYIYKQKSTQIKGIFVFAHGYGGGGHHCYLDLIDTITKEGFLVFAYDATASDESEGKSMRGFTQGLLDADKAISFVESMKEYKNLPLYLCGHSWGAYSMSNALDFHPRAKGLIAFSGFNKSTSIFEANGELYSGEASRSFYEVIEKHEYDIFGSMSEHTAIDSFKNSKAKIVIVHSEDDHTVPISAGYDLYYPLFKNNKRFKFIHYTNRGHGTIFYTQSGRKYVDSLNKTYKKFIKEKHTDEENDAYALKIIDRKKLTSLVDTKLIKECIKFIK